MSQEEQAQQEIDEKSEQHKAQAMDNIRSYYIQQGKSIIRFPTDHPLTFVAGTYAVTFVFGMLVGIIF